MTRKPDAKAAAFHVSLTDDGLHLDNSILWFDAVNSGDLTFLSAATATTATATAPTVPQVIATEETVRILEALRRRPAALTCQYNRPFSIGRLRMELLPSGAVLGGASLFVETERGRLLYAPNLQPHRLPTVRKMQLRHADALILGSPDSEPGAIVPQRRRERERFLETVQSLARGDAYPVIVCDPIGTAQELTRMLTDAGLPVSTHDVIFRVNQVYESYGSKLGPFLRYSRRHARQKVVLFPRPARRGAALPSHLPEGPLLVVEQGVEVTLPSSTPRIPVDIFHLGSGCSTSDLKEIVATVAPKELLVFGPYAKRYVDELGGTCPMVRPLFVNDQPTLF